MKTKLIAFLALFSPLCMGAQQTVGLFSYSAQAGNGYVLFSPMSYTQTYLIDKCGKEVHSWQSNYKPGLSVYLLPDGSLLRSGVAGNTVFNAGGNGGVIEKLDWNSNVVWSYTISSSTECQHHDICPLPNGNILAIVWESKTDTEAIQMGRNPQKVGQALWSEKILELQPVGTNSVSIVWEWHVWDHLAQDYSASYPNYDTVSNHPELININYQASATNSDWIHANALAYNASLDQIMLSNHNFSEIWIIDHSTTTAEAASHTGGARHKGGDLLYRWGNPEAYNRGTSTDKKLFGQHNPHWIENGYNDAGKIMVFNNGLGRTSGNYSSVDVIVPAADTNGNYTIAPGQAFNPDSAEWSYTAVPNTSFFSNNISSAQRLSNGNTLICEGTKGNFFEIDSLKNTVWRYVSPVNSNGPITQGNAAAQNNVFRCTQYEATYSGLNGQTLNPGNPIELNPIASNCSAGITNASEFSGIIVSNPFQDEIRLFTGQALSSLSIELKGINGCLIRKWENVTIAGNLVLSLDRPLSPGIYIFTLSKNGMAENYKLIKTK